MTVDFLKKFINLASVDMEGAWCGRKDDVRWVMIIVREKNQVTHIAESRVVILIMSVMS